MTSGPALDFESTYSRLFIGVGLGQQMDIKCRRKEAGFLKMKAASRNKSVLYQGSICHVFLPSHL